jgi:hypothetical protein
MMMIIHSELFHYNNMFLYIFPISFPFWMRCYHHRTVVEVIGVMVITCHGTVPVPGTVTTRARIIENLPARSSEFLPTCGTLPRCSTT